MSEMLGQIETLGDQLRWAAELEPPPSGTHSEVLYVGMGGSGVAGDYARAIAGPSGTRVSVHKSYGPVPAWAQRVRPLVIAASYSGNTEETLDFAKSAQDTGLTVATVTTGGRLGELSEEHGWTSIAVPSGLQPRAAAGYMIGAVIKILEGARAIDDQRLALRDTIDLVDRALTEGSSRWEQAQALAEAASGRIPIIYGGGPVTVPVAQRWKTQVNENAKIPAWSSALPELDHNELVGWETMPEMTSEHLGIIALTDRDDPDRVADRFEFTRELTEDAVPWLGQVSSEGTSTLARLISLTVVGDLFSYFVAEGAGVDPLPVQTIEKLKKLLAKEDR